MPADDSVMVSTEVPMATPVSPEPPVPEDDQNTNWLDTGQRYVTNSADRFAGWVDHFFGSSRAEIESAYSILRLTAENTWQESAAGENNIRLRGKVHLPRINKRLSLVFTDENDNELTQDEELPRPVDDSTNTESGLQYTVREKEQDRLDLKVGLRSTGKLKTSMRYRYQWPISETVVNRAIETVYFRDGEGFGSRLSLQHDRLIDDTHLFRWSNDATFAEESDGVNWSSQLSLAQRLDKKSAVTYFSWVSGVTRPEYLTRSYGLGIRYRRSFYRDWLFYEVEPAYAWTRADIDADREPGLLVSVRLEVLFERERKGKRK